MTDENKRPHTLDDDKVLYLKAFIAHRLLDIADLAMNKNTDAVALFVFYIEQAMGGVKADEAGIVDYWQNLRRVEDALMSAGLPA